MLEGKRIAILAEDDFEDSELMEPLNAMKSADARVVIVGSGSKDTYRARGVEQRLGSILPQTRPGPRILMPSSSPVGTLRIRCVCINP